MARRATIYLLLLLTALAAAAQMQNPVTWQKQVRMTGPHEGVATFTARISPGWHMYATHIPEGGPNALTVEWNNQGVELEGELKASKAPQRAHDETFDMDLAWWTGTVTLSQRFKVTGKSYTVAGTLRAQACNDQTCTPPTPEAFSFAGTASQPAVAVQPQATTAAAPAVEQNAAAMPLTTDSATPAAATAAPPQQAANAAIDTAALWAPVTPVATTGDNGNSQGRSLVYIFWACFLGGLLALVTPCVWPMIPMTVSFFLKQSGNRRKSIAGALAYGASIIVIFLLLGVVVTAIFGAGAMNALATNAVVNVAFFLLLVLFAVAFFGAFELKLPDSWSNRMDQRAERATGLLSIFFMAATLVVVSFSCTGPIIGTLLVEAAAQGHIMGPVVGMTGFALALAIPFALFALFPSLLKRLPRSGGWLNTVKVSLGFIELALSLKFLSVADMAYGWHILDRETFLALWIAIFGCLGLYLLGAFRFKSDGEPRHSGIGVTRFMCALAALAFTAYLVPGLWGAPLKATSAFVPPLSTQDFNLYGGGQSEYEDYEAGMAAAARAGKPVFIDFSGYGCVNCRKMEGAVLANSRVKSALANDFVTIQLMVDDKTPLPHPIIVQENGKTLTLTRVGDKWSYLQQHKFGTNSQPYYVVLDPQGRLLSGPFAYKEDVDAFVSFLSQGRDKMK